MTSNGEVLKENRNLGNVKKTQESGISTRVFKENAKVFRKVFLEKNIQNSIFFF